MKRRTLVAVAGAVLVLAPGAARAHLVTTGLGPVYDGVSHLFLSFDDLLPVVAMALLAGLNGAAAGRRSLFALPLAWLASGLAGHQAGGAPLPPWITALSLLVLGVLVASNLRLATASATACAAALGSVHGWLNGAGIAADGREASGLLGIAAAIFVVSALASALVVSLRAPWARVAVRVAGSWIAAIGLLSFGWQLRINS